jgi:hypothetical protein
MYPDVSFGVCRIVSFPVSMCVFLVNVDFVVEVFGLVTCVRTRQDVISGVYNGVPGFGFRRARYYVNSIFKMIHFYRFCLV